MSTSLWDQLIEEGKAEGEARGKAGTILVVLQARFDRIPESIRDAVSVIADQRTLEELAALAATCDSLDEFSEALK